MHLLDYVAISGYKSIKKAELKLGPLNVFIGANGSGKSNFVSFFKMVNHMMTGALQRFIGQSGGADSLLHYGSKTTAFVEATLHLQTPGAEDTYYMRLGHAAVDTLIFLEERITYARRDHPGRPFEKVLDSGHKETALGKDVVERGSFTDAERNTIAVFRDMLNRCRVFQFHDTSATAYIRQNGDIDQNRYLMSDGGNLAAMLHKLQTRNPECYRRIVGTIRQVAPFFEDFRLSPMELDPTKIQLRWKERNREFDFGPHLLSDGTLRAMALITLLLQPENDLPSVIIIDEPELGLHPYAISVLAGLLRMASSHSQIMVATESPTFLDQFTPEEVVVTERCEGESVFRRLSHEGLRSWLEDYCLSDLWAKNVIGGRPSR